MLSNSNNDIEMRIMPSISTSDPHSGADTGSDANSDSEVCRYCFCAVNDNHSICACHSALCRACLERELCLTEGRQDHVLQCTVCATQYDVEYLDDAPHSCVQELAFAMKETFRCSNLQVQGRRVPSVRERVALALLMVFLSLWTAATTYSIVDPGISAFKGFSAELLVYLFLVFMDFCVGLSMCWFVRLVDTLQLTLPFALNGLHFFRCALVVVLRFAVLDTKGHWKMVGSLGTCFTSLCVICTCMRIYLRTAKSGYKRILTRNRQIMLGGKDRTVGPFRLRDLAN